MSEDATAVDPDEQDRFADADHASSDEESEDESTCQKCRSLSEAVDSSVEDQLKKLEENLEKPLHGWPELAKTISEHPDFEAFPAFRDLNIKSLLYYQAELHWLRKKLHRMEYENHTAKFKNAPALCNNVQYLLLAQEYKGSDKQAVCAQIELINKIRKVLKAYNTALLQYSQINKLPEADPVNVNCLRTWIQEPAFGDKMINGPGQDSWGPINEDPPKDTRTIGRHFLHIVRTLFYADPPKKNTLDLVQPRAEKKIDGLTSWVAKEFVPWWHRVHEVGVLRCICGVVPRQGKQVDDPESPRSCAEREKTISASSSSKKTTHSFISWLQKPQKDESPKKKPPSLETYSEDRMLRFTAGVCTVVACLFPVIAIIVLSTMHSMRETLGFLTLFTFLFAVGLMFLTEAGTRRTDIFTATAAFSAVLVVFVTNQTQNSGSGVGSAG